MVFTEESRPCILCFFAQLWHHTYFVGQLSFRMLLVDKTSPKFVYANGLLLLTIVFMPFPTAFLAEYIWTDLAAPAVVLYSLVNLMQSVAWTVMMRSAVYPVPLCKNEHSKNVLKETYRISFYAILVYGACTVLAFWFPQAISMIITFIWIMWLFWGLHFKQGQPRKINLKM